MRRAVGFGLVCLLGCFDPGIAPLRCSEAQPACPDGLLCKGGMCQTADSADASMIFDANFVDMQSPDMSQSGCASGKGIPIGGMGCWGCPGLFDSAKSASGLCAVGFTLPANAAKIPDSECQKVTGGFFMSSLFGASSVNFSDLNYSQCGFFTMGVTGFFGCGQAQGSGTLNTAAACNGFRQHLQCGGPNGLICPKNDINLDTNSISTNGVICCK